MKKEIKVPTMGESISTAVIGSILKPSGSLVAEGEEIIELETEKVNQVLYSPAKGVVQWQVKKDESVSVGQVIGVIDPDEKPVPDAKEQQTQTKDQPVEKTSEIPQKKDGEQVTPRENSLGSRLKKEQFIQELLQSEKPIPLEKPLPSIPEKSEQKPEFVRQKMSSIRKTIARRLVDSLHQSAMLTTFNEVDMTAIMEFRKKYQESFKEKHGVKLGFMSFFVKAVVEALKEFPMMHAFIDGEDIVQRTTYDIGIAIGAEKGLVVPVLRNCDHLSFANIENAILEFAKKANQGKLQISDLQGGGFTITNGGVYGSLLSTPILNPPQSGILGMHNIVQRAVVFKNEIVARPMMYLALSYDHRIVDGKEAVLFLVKIKEVIEDPARLLFFEKEHLQ